MAKVEIKSSDKNDGTFGPSLDIRFSLAAPADNGGSPIGGGRRLFDGIRAALAEPRARLGDTWRQALPTLLATLTLRQLRDVAANRLPGLAGYVDARSRMETRRNAMIDDAGGFADDWESWARRPKNRAEARAVADLMHGATLAKVDPSDYQPLQVAVKLGPSELFWRDRPATLAQAAELMKRARQLARSRKQEDKGLAPYYMLASQKVRVAAKAELARAKALLALERQWATLSDGQTFDDAGKPYADRELAQVAIAQRSARGGDLRGKVVTPRQTEDGWVLQELGGRQVFVMARDTYERRSKEMMEALLERVRESRGLAEKSKEQLIAQIRREFEQTTDETGNPRIGPYFPLQRFGNLYAYLRKLPTATIRHFRKHDGEPFASESAARSAQRRRDLRGIDTQPQELADGGWALVEVGEPWFGTFESETERRRAVDKMTAQGWRVIRQGATALSGNPGEVVSEGFIAQAVQQLTHKGDKDAADMLYQMYLTQMQQMSMRKHFIHRKGTAGYSQDALRGFGWNMTRLANQIAKLEHVPTLERLLGEIESDMKEAQRSADGVDATVANHLFKELTLRHQWIMSPDNHPLTNIAAALGFIYYVSPAAALVNLTQTAIVAYPVLASRYGWQGAGTALTTALLDVARGFSPIVVKGFLTGRPLPSQAANLSDEERAAFTAWNSSGIRDRTQAHNLAGIGDSDNFLNGPVFNRTMAIISSGFHAAEVVNRDATLLAAYRLARAAGTGHEQAITEAEEATWTAHFDYANANRARMMQGNWAKVLLMFKSYSQHMLYFLGRNLYLATRGESPEVQRAARVQLGGVLGMTGLFAGALGLPLVGTLFSVMNLVAATFGDDDDPWDTETEFRNWLAATFPASVAGIIDGGAVSTLTGLDWHSRVGLDGLVWRSPDRDLNGAGTFAYVVEQLLGPFGGMLAQPFTAVDLIADGQWQRAAEAIAPKFLRDPLRAGRYAAEGVLTKIGEPVVERERLSTYELLWKALGMNPAQIAVQYEANAAVKLYESRILERRQQLQAAYAMAYLHGESAALPKIQAQITAFNRAQPTIPISPSTLRAAIRGRQRAALETTHGIRVNRRLEQVRDVGAFGG